MDTPRRLHMEEKVIQLSDYLTFDPILRKGDVVRIVLTDEFEWEADEEEIMEFDGHTGIVTGIEIRYPQDHDEAPGQAAYIDISVPTGFHGDPGPWKVFHAVSIHHVRRLVTSSQIMRESKD